ncbi:MAG: hypothetical protein HY074_12900 [Deltaproteobacteria bacterium]|nr:hypothetical protein [Deltaproteobacteria bacterium]
MILAVVKELVARHSKDELDQAIAKFEADLTNTLNVAGADDGEKLSNLLAAAGIRARVDQGMSVNDAIREHSQRVRSILSKPAKKPTP